MAVWPFAQKSGVDTAVRGRLALSSLWTPSRDAPLKVTSGFVDDGGGVVSVVGGTMDISITPFRAIIQGASSGTQGAYPVVCDANEVVTLPNGGGADVQYTISAVVEDSTYDASGQQRARVIAYTTAGGPPAGVVSVLPLRLLNLRANVSAGTGGLVGGDLLADQRVFTVALGGIRRVLSTARPATPHLGQTIFESDTLNTMVWDGVGWRDVRRRFATQMRQNAGQSINSVVDTKVNLTVTDLNVGGMADLVNDRALVQKTGLYRAYGQTAFAPSGTAGTYRRCSLRVNGSQVVVGVPLDPNVAGGLPTIPHVSYCMSLNSGDYVELWCLQTNPGALATHADASYFSYLNLEWIGPNA